MRFGSVCSGVEAASLAWEPLGWSPQFFAEIERFPSAVLAHRWPEVPNLGDFTAINGAEWRDRIDVLVAGTPCQAFSVAGLRESLGDARGNLTLRFVELVHAIDPWAVVWENVPGVLTTQDNAFGCFLAGLVGADAPLVPPRGLKWTDAGMVAGPTRSAAWRVLDAQYVHLAQRRERVFVVSFRTRDGLNPGAVLFEPESVRRHSPPRRETGERPAPTIAARTRGGGGLGTDFDCDGGLIPSVAHSLRADGFDASEDGTGRGTPLVATVGTLSPGAHPGTYNGQDAYTGHLLPFAFSWQSGGDGRGLDPRPVTSALTKGQTPAVAAGMAVRRLTPRECERLQGMPDDHTRIPWRGKPADQCPDGPRYRAIGNSMAVTVMRWIGLRLGLVKGGRISLH